MKGSVLGPAVLRQHSWKETERAGLQGKGQLGENVRLLFSPVKEKAGAPGP